jgi:FkbM family methyltransferase
MQKSILDSLFKLLPKVKNSHAPSTELHNFLKLSLRKEIVEIFSDNIGNNPFGPFGDLHFPYFSMGNIDSLNLFDLDEIIMFSFYWQNRHRYKKVLDVGANIGLHSIIMNKCGFDVSAFEPATNHFSRLQENLLLNDIDMCAHNVGVSNHTGELEFILVKGNTTGSHIAGAKAAPYGELERYKIPVVNFENLLEDVDFVKMDIEGHEKEVICTLPVELFQKFDLMLSIHDEENAKAIFNYFSKHNINMFSQKTNWGKVRTLDDMIVTHHDGSLFVSCKEEMYWGDE